MAKYTLKKPMTLRSLAEIFYPKKFIVLGRPHKNAHGIKITLQLGFKFYNRLFSKATLNSQCFFFTAMFYERGVNVKPGGLFGRSLVILHIGSPDNHDCSMTCE